MKVGVTVLGSLSLTVPAVSVDIKQHWTPVPKSPYGLCGRKATLNCQRAQELCESRGGRPGLPVPNSPYGFCGRIATLDSRP